MLGSVQRQPSRGVAGPARDSERGRWLHLCNGLDPVRDGGMVPSILGMTRALDRLGGRISIVTVTPSRLSDVEREGLPRLEGPEVSLERAVAGAEVAHLHGLWQDQTRRGARAASRSRIPYLIAAHGMAEPWALAQKRWKKKLYLALVESRNLRGSACLHALSRPEIDHLRGLAPWTPVAFVPNGVDLSAFDDPPPRSLLEAEHPELVGKTIILFYGRLHPKKGLDMLAESFARLAPDYPSAHLLLAGNDDGAWAPFRDRILALGLAGKTTYLGHVAGEQARRVWGAADCFVLPSYSEGFSMAVLEAMAASLPCLITTACHFPESAAAGAAVVVEPRSESVERGLREMLDRTPQERRRLGRTARGLVEASYTWDRQADRLASVYQWLSGGGPAPDCVVL